MDDRRFDALTKSLAGAHSRRGVLKALSGAALGALGLAGADHADAKKDSGGANAGGGNSVCAHWCHANFSGRDAGRCTSDAAQGGGVCYGCGPAAPAGNGLQFCGGVCIPTCPAPDQCHLPGSCDPAAHACSNPPVPKGTACDDGDACTQTDACDGNGTCIGNNPIVCKTSDQCHVAGVCDPASGVCSNPLKADGSTCDDGDACTQTDSCQAGVCIGSNPVVCQPLDQCHVAGTCNSATGICSNPDAANGASCNDGNACTSGDACQAGQCVGGTPVVCATDNPCLVASCDPGTGCVTTPKTAGAPCDDATLCNGHETCDGFGRCQSGTPVNCGPCTVCDPGKGACTPDPAQIGKPCPGDANRCHGGFQCSAAGTCVATTTVTCPAPADPCHLQGTCQPATGLCTNPNAPDATSCDDGNPCTTGDHCVAGVCTGAPVTCPALDQCHVAGTCDPATGVCSTPLALDGTVCGTGEICCGGVCGAHGGCPCGQQRCGDNVCRTCCPTGACATGQTCGSVPDGCGGVIACGTCPPPQTCGGGGTPGRCGCAPSCPAGTCGADGCGGICACPTGQTCTKGQCCPTGTVVCHGVCCATGASCIAPPPGSGLDPFCECGPLPFGAPPQIVCSGVCVEPSADPANCGACGNKCATGQTCTKGQCCPTGTVVCHGVCCATGASCIAPPPGSGLDPFCECGPLPFGAPPQIVCSGVCVEPSADPANCGACGNKCATGQTCTKGQCCPTGTVVCHGVCCATGASCIAPPPGSGLDPFCECGPLPFGAPPQIVCSGVCVEPSADPANCGACGHVCPPGTTCSSGACVCAPTTCAAQHAECGLLADGCGHSLTCGSCSSGARCVNNACVI